MPHRPKKFINPKTGRGYPGFRIIGAFKLLGGLGFLALGFGLFRLFKGDVVQQVGHLVALLRLDPENRVIHWAIHWITGLDRKHLHAIEAGTFVYAILHLIEGTGLILQRRWAGYFTVIITGSLVPVEVYEVYHKPGAVKVALLALNLAILAYLIWRLRQEQGAKPEEAPLAAGVAG